MQTGVLKEFAETWIHTYIQCTNIYDNEGHMSSKSTLSERRKDMVDSRKYPLYIHWYTRPIYWEPPKSRKYQVYIPDLYIEYNLNHDGSLQRYIIYSLTVCCFILATILIIGFRSFHKKTKSFSRLWTWGRCKRFRVSFVLPLSRCWITFQTGRHLFLLYKVEISWSW